jgi:hypothetical protein
MKPSRCQRPMIGCIQLIGSNQKIYLVTCQFQEDYVRITTYENANLMHDLLMGRSVTGCIHLVNQTPIYWSSKQQNLVETAMYGWEFVAARLAIELIMDLKDTLRSLGVPIDGPAWMIGDNQGVITSSTIPHSSLNKRHNALSYHRVREAIASKVMYFLHVPGVWPMF